MKTAARVVVSLLVAGALVAGLMLWGGVSADELAAAWRRIPPSALVLAFALYAMQIALRAARFQLLVPPERRPTYACALSVTAAYGMATLILPAKIGEASFVLYLGRAGGVGTAEALAALVVARLLDFASLFLGFGVACIVVAAGGAHAELPWLAPLGVALLAASVAALAASARGDLFVRFATALSRHAGVTRFAPMRRLVARVEILGDALREAARGGRAWNGALVSLPMWGLVFAFCAVLGRGFGLPETLSFAQASFGASLAITTSLVPLSAFANFGTLETGWVLGFGAFGVSRELALATGTGLHLVQIALAVLLGALGHVGMGLVAQRAPRAA